MDLIGWKFKKKLPILYRQFESTKVESKIYLHESSGMVILENPDVTNSESAVMVKKKKKICLCIPVFNLKLSNRCKYNKQKM
jgi:hypothetical protein